MENKIDRRNFMRSSAAIGASLFVAPAVIAGTAGKADDINIALLGAGTQGRVLTDSMLKIPGIKFKAVCDIWKSYNLGNMSRLLKKYRHENNAYVDYREMLDKEKDLDAVVIATPDFRHAEHTNACLNAGLHVYCEKEMSNTLEGAKSMVQTAKKTGKLLQIGHQRRSNPRYLHCYNRLIKEANLLNRITTINGQWNRAAREDYVALPKYHIDQATLTKYGFKSMPQFMNWRWYKGLGGGPFVDLGSHQIDIFAWFLGANPSAVIANGGTDYYDKKTHEWYDTVMAIYEYQTKQGVVRAFYQTITTNSSQGYFETFMGDKGTLQISESASRGSVYREPSAPQWDKWVKKGVIKAPAKDKCKEAYDKCKEDKSAVLDVRETLAPPAFEIPVTMGGKKYHQPHLENFFNAIRGKEKLNCPAEIGYETAVAVLKANEAVEANKRLEFKKDEFEV